MPDKLCECQKRGGLVKRWEYEESTANGRDHEITVFVEAAVWHCEHCGRSWDTWRRFWRYSDHEQVQNDFNRYLS